MDGQPGPAYLPLPTRFLDPALSRALYVFEEICLPQQISLIKSKFQRLDGSNFRGHQFDFFIAVNSILFTKAPRHRWQYHIVFAQEPATLLSLS